MKRSVTVPSRKSPKSELSGGLRTGGGGLAGTGASGSGGTSSPSSGANKLQRKPRGGRDGKHRSVSPGPPGADLKRAGSLATHGSRRGSPPSTRAGVAA